MFTFDIIINPFILLAAAIGGLILGFMIGRRKLAKSHRKVMELEREMVAANAEVLDIQKAYVQLEQKLRENAIPVISMKLNGKENPKEKASK